MPFFLLLLFAQSQLDTANQQINAGQTQAALQTLSSLTCSDAPCSARQHALSGAAHLYEARYDLALQHFSQALDLYTRLQDPAHRIDLHNNIGSVHFFRGQYAEAHLQYQQARRLLASHTSAPWYPSALQFTNVNLATLYQKLGRHRDALALYQSVHTAHLPPHELAQSLSNRAVLLRRLGDPYKARLLLEQALALQPHQDTRLGILKNLGILLALDFQNPTLAARYFDQVQHSADAAHDLRESLQARLYRAELAYRQHDYRLAAELWQASLQLSTQAQVPEEKWRSLYGLARLARSRPLILQALESIESLRSGIGAPTLKSDFLSDKASVYEFALTLDYESSDPAAAFHTIERARALSLRESLPTAPPPLTLRAFQSRLLPQETALLLEPTESHTYALWITTHTARLERLPLPKAQAARLVASRSYPELERLLFPTAPPAFPGRLWLIPDGPLALLPLELLLPENTETAYLPAAWFLHPPTAQTHLPHFPWQAQLTAIGPTHPDAATHSTPHLLPGDDQLPPLPAATLELDAIARLLPGRTLRPTTTSLSTLNAAPLLHLATHAIADPESSQRHRILLPDTYLYASQLQPATLDHVQLAVLSACDTSRGPQLRGEGVQSLSRAFLAAGVRATIASHWKVDDQATRLFMQRLYTHLREQSPLSTALLRTRQEFRAARAPAGVWAAFTVQGAARDTIPASYSWPQCLAVLGVLLALAAWALTRRPSSRPPTAARL